MRRIVKALVLETGSLYVVSQVASGMYFQQGIKTLFIAGFALGASSMLVRPALNVLILPLNLVTFGLFRWVSNVAILYIVALLVQGFDITSFSFPGLITGYFSIPPIFLPGILGYLGYSLLLSILNSFFYWLVK